MSPMWIRLPRLGCSNSSPLDASHPTSGRRRRLPVLAVIVVVVFTAILFLHDSLPPFHPSPLPEFSRVTKQKPIPQDAACRNRPLKDVSRNGNAALTLDELRAMVSQTNGYFGRDWSVHLGWNNMRYIIETGLLQARLLNRTLVIPSFLYARSCEWEFRLCAAFATQIVKGDAMHRTEWDYLPWEQRIAWKIPTPFMFDLPHLRKSHNVILVSEYLRLQGLDPLKETSDGSWSRTDYQKSPRDLTIIPNSEYDPNDILRVDSLGPLWKVSKEVDLSSGITQKLFAVMARNKPPNYVEWKDVREIVGPDHSNPAIEAQLAGLGWAVLYTFVGGEGNLWAKSVIDPIKEVSPINRLKGWTDDYASVNSPALIIEGETHLERKPGAMRFTTPLERANFIRTVLFAMSPVDVVHVLADAIVQRISERVKGRMWMAAHMRRKDFLSIGWISDYNPEIHIRRIKKNLATGLRTLKSIVSSHEALDITGVSSDKTIMSLVPPLANDPFFLATDDRSDETRKQARAAGAILIDDLLTIEDRQDFGWTIAFSDILGLVEQAVVSKAHFLYLSRMSSWSGGAANMHIASGADRRTVVMD